MAEFNELMKNFDKVRAYMRDFFIYGFKVRQEYTYKSLRTYDNEKRRIESWLADYLRWDYSVKGKQVFLSVDCAQIAGNPLYAAWKSKSFTDNDLMLHVFLLALLKDNQTLSVEQLTNQMAAQFEVIFDHQLVRKKANEYVTEGLLMAEKRGKVLYYRLSEAASPKDWSELLTAVTFFAEAAPLGVIGSFILDNTREKNTYFRFKHYFIVHTLDDEILLTLLQAIRAQCVVSLCQGNKQLAAGNKQSYLPLKILFSEQTGRAYVTVYDLAKQWFANIRLDRILMAEQGELVSETADYQRQLAEVQPHCWGVSFSNQQRLEQIKMTLAIDERREDYILQRLHREGRGGVVERVAENIFVYSHRVYDTNEMVPWIKTFTGRILELCGDNSFALHKIRHDLDRLYGMYCQDE